MGALEQAINALLLGDIAASVPGLDFERMSGLLARESSASGSDTNMRPLTDLHKKAD
jgi:hypothetical protein